MQVQERTDDLKTWSITRLIITELAVMNTLGSVQAEVWLTGRLDPPDL